MDVTTDNEQDAISDYGSDFTPDVEVVLDGLLQQHNTSSEYNLDLLLADIESNEIAYRAKLPSRRLSHKTQSGNQTPVWRLSTNEKKFPPEINCHENGTATRKSNRNLCGTTK